MLDAKFVTENLEFVNRALSKRSGNYSASRASELDIERRKLIAEVEVLKSERNRTTETISIKKRNKENADDMIAGMKALGDRIKDLDASLAVVEQSMSEVMLSLPNIPHTDVPEGSDSEDNVEVRRHLEPTKFDFAPKPHWELGESLGIIDPAAAAKLTGARFMVYKGAGARLERAIQNFMLNTHTEQAGYTEIFPPFLANRDSMTGTGQLPKFEEDMFAVTGTGYYLIPTAEVPVTNLHRGDILPAESLPIKYTAYTACFRAEAGSAGRDTRGLIRQHQFNKVELVKFAHPDKSFEELESLTADAERILKLLNLPYRVVTLCTGDLGFSSAKTYDIEVWMPSYGRYVEISSCSNFMDFQARRMNIRFRDTDGKPRLVHTLNGSGLAVGRTTAAILENFQNSDGTITVPEVLRPYMGTGIIR